MDFVFEQVHATECRTRSRTRDSFLNLHEYPSGNKGRATPFFLYSCSCIEVGRLLFQNPFVVTEYILCDLQEIRVTIFDNRGFFERGNMPMKIGNIIRK